MNREERRRAARDKRPVAALRRVGAVEPGHERAETQDFIAGTIFAAGAASVYPVERFPGQEPAELPPLFVVLLHDDESTFGPWPALRAILARVDAHGGGPLAEQLAVATSWSLLDGPDPLVKLKLDVREPHELRSSARLLLLANNYPQIWPDIADGGMVAVTTMSRYQAVIALGDAASPADVMDRSLLMGIAASPVLRHLIAAHGWSR